MSHRLRLALALGFGTAVTVTAARLGWRLLCTALTQVGEASTVDAGVRLEAGRALYFSHGEVLIFPAEAHRVGRTVRYEIQIPDQWRWAREMPHWSRHVRGQVLADMARVVTGEPIDLVEATASPSGFRKPWSAVKHE